MKNNVKVKVFIAGFSSDESKELSCLIDLQNDMNVVGVAANINECISSMSSTVPDIALISISMIEKNITASIDKLKQNRSNIKILILSEYINYNIIKVVMSENAPFIILTSCKDKNIPNVIRKLTSEYRKQDDTICDISSEDNSELYDSSAYAQAIPPLLNKLNILGNVKGYYYLRDAVLMALEDEGCVIGITKNIYPNIAIMHKTSSGRVERAIRHAIESSWKKGGDKIYNQLIGVNYCMKPANSQFIASLAQYIKINSQKTR